VALLVLEADISTLYDIDYTGSPLSLPYIAPIIRNGILTNPLE
jgi:hypothetical protein